MNPEAKIKQLGLKLPEPPKPVGAYAPAVRIGTLLFVSGQVPLVEGEIKYRGKVGRELTIDDGYEAARIAAMNCLSIAKSIVGDLDEVEGVVKLTGFVNCADDFDQQPKVVNGASELFIEIFGEAGRPARTSVGVNSLPSDAAVEIEVTFRIQGPGVV